MGGVGGVGALATTRYAGVNRRDEVIAIASDAIAFRMNHTTREPACDSALGKLKTQIFSSSSSPGTNQSAGSSVTGTW